MVMCLLTLILYAWHSLSSDSGLTQKGLMFAKALGDFIVNDELGVDAAAELCVWNSPLRASKGTATEVRAEH